MITLLVMTDGRGEYLKRTLTSAERNLRGDISRTVIHDDSGDQDYRCWLTEYFPDYRVVGNLNRQGYSGAVRNAWWYLDHDAVDPRDTNRFTFHLEDDFVFNRPVDLDEIAEFLDDHWWLAQMGLRRGRWGREAAGFVEDSPSAYEERREVAWKHTSLSWIEHRLYYTMTPHLYRSRLRSVGWPDGEGSEIHFKDKLLQSGLPWNVPSEHVKFGFWGNTEDGANAVTHIGEERRGFGY